MRDGDDERYFHAIKKLICNSHPLSTQPYEVFKVWPTNADRDDFQVVMEAEDVASVLKGYGVPANSKSIGRNIPDAYIFFQDAITGWLSEARTGTREKKIAALYSAIRDNVRLVVIDLDEKDDAQLIFETLNARGTPLLAADLVKNSLLSEIQTGGQNAEIAYQKHWQQFDLDSGFWRAEVGRGHAKRARIEIFLQHTLTLLTGEEVAAGHLYAAYRDFATEATTGPALERLHAFKKYGAIYKELQGDHDNMRVNLFLERLRTMDVGTVYPFLLKLFDVLGDQEDKLVETLTSVESFLVRRMVCRLSTRGYNRLFVDLIQSLDVDPANIRANVEATLSDGTAEYDRWPKNDEFREAWTEKPLFENLTRPRLRLLLEGLESGLHSKYAETHAVPKNLTVEHVMPQSWERYWPLPEHANHVEATLRRDKIIHTIGNLTLLNGKLNPTQSNKPWVGGPDFNDGKREALRKHSVLFLNKQICKYENWDESIIVARSRDLFGVAASIWEEPPS